MTLNLGEIHPSAPSAMGYVKSKLADPEFFRIKESLESIAMFSRSHEICHETLQRIESNEKVSDRYLLGLAWFLKELDESMEKIL